MSTTQYDQMGRTYELPVTNDPGLVTQPRAYSDLTPNRHRRDPAKPIRFPAHYKPVNHNLGQKSKPSPAFIAAMLIGGTVAVFVGLCVLGYIVKMSFAIAR